MAEYCWAISSAGAPASNAATMVSSVQALYRAQAVLDGRVVVAGPRQNNHPDFPLRGFVRCESCGRPLTGSWSKGRNGH
jgi:hypothetical protein